jgi:predicted nucleotidyltransferase
MKDLLRIFEEHGVRYVLVGGFAVIYYGYVRMTQDIDILLYPSEDNAMKIIASLREFGFGEAGIPTEYFAREGAAIHLGVEPNRVDLLTSQKGIPNDRIFANARRVTIEDLEVNMISFGDLLDVKRASGRLRDQADADELSSLSGE